MTADNMMTAEDQFIPLSELPALIERQRAEIERLRRDYGSAQSLAIALREEVHLLREENRRLTALEASP